MFVKNKKIKNKTLGTGASEIVQRVKAQATKTENLSLNLRIHTIEKFWLYEFVYAQNLKKNVI